MNVALRCQPKSRGLGLAVLLLSCLVGCGGDEPAAPSPTPSPTPLADAPSPRWDHTAVWTGSRMLVWGGEGEQYDPALGTRLKNDGGSYDPETNTWTTLTTEGAPSPRDSHLAIWAGSRMIVWGGRGDRDPVTDVTETFFDGGAYDPTTDTWTPLSTVDAPDFSGGVGVSTGPTAIMWGGYVIRDDGFSEWTNAGRIYDPATDTWTRTTRTGAPPPSYLAVGVWTGSRMIVWDPWIKRGGSYDPVSNTWEPIASRGSPPICDATAAVWAASRLIVWGGFRDRDIDYPDETNLGGAYDPATDTWSATWIKGAPEARVYHTLVSTGSTMIVWGGHGSEPSGGLSYASGAAYDPMTDTWTPTSLRGVPLRRHRHSAVWTGSRMIVWGGQGEYDAVLRTTLKNTGGVYDPETDTWTETALTRPPGS